jgi:cell wall-associated NlpC family hydrolase
MKEIFEEYEREKELLDNSTSTFILAKEIKEGEIKEKENSIEEKIKENEKKEKELEKANNVEEKEKLVNEIEEIKNEKIEIEQEIEEIKINNETLEKDLELIKEQSERINVVLEANSWLMTPYHHEGKRKGVGIDCAMFLYEVFRHCNLVPEMTFPRYSPQWHLHKNEELYLHKVIEFAKRVYAPLPGDIVLYKFARTFSHGAIVVKWPKIIHAVPYLGVIYDTGNEFSVGEHKPKETEFYSYWMKK